MLVQLGNGMSHQFAEDPAKPLIVITAQRHIGLLVEFVDPHRGMGHLVGNNPSSEIRRSQSDNSAQRLVYRFETVTDSQCLGMIKGFYPRLVISSSCCTKRCHVIVNFDSNDPWFVAVNSYGEVCEQFRPPLTGCPRGCAISPVLAARCDLLIECGPVVVLGPIVIRSRHHLELPVGARP
jgi:hypothetical protein